MSNQVAMTFESAITFDKAFVEDRLNECLSLLQFQVQRCLDGLSFNADLCEKASESFFNFIRHAEVSNGFTDAERTELMFRFFGLKGAIEELQNAEQPTVRQADDSATQPVASTQLPVFRVLGQVTKANSFSQSINTLYGSVCGSTGITWLSPKRGCFTPATAQLLSNTRSIGGLGQ